jgi:hypothetical protein
MTFNFEFNPRLWVFGAGFYPRSPYLSWEVSLYIGPFWFYLRGVKK